MKRIIIALVAVFMLQDVLSTADAQGLLTRKEYKGRKETSAYMQGAVPEENGKVVFRQKIVTDAKTKEQVFRNLQQWLSLRYMANTTQGEWTDPTFYKNQEFAQVKEADAATGHFLCQGDEELVFASRALVYDATKFRYVLEVNVQADGVEAVVRNIDYTYMLTDAPQRIEAEDWITDKEAFSSKGKLLKVSAKFRIKTIDAIEALFSEIGKAANK